MSEYLPHSLCPQEPDAPHDAGCIRARTDNVEKANEELEKFLAQYGTGLDMGTLQLVCLVNKLVEIGVLTQHQVDQFYLEFVEQKNHHLLEARKQIQKEVEKIEAAQRRATLLDPRIGVNNIKRR